MDGWDRTPKKWWKKNGLQNVWVLSSLSKSRQAKGKEGRKEEKYQLWTELACSIGTLLKCNMEKGKRKKDPSREGGTTKDCLDIDQKLLTSVCTSGWLFQLSVRKWNLEWYLTVIMWTPYHLKKSPQQEKTWNTQKEGQHGLFVLCTWKNGPEWKTNTHQGIM